jgi:hypothetical protein
MLTCHLSYYTEYEYIVVPVAYGSVKHIIVE